MRLVNVRLDAEDDRKARALRSEGIQVSELVRKAIRREYERRVEARVRRQRPSAVVEEVLRAFPDERARGRRGFALDDRAAMRAHIVDKLRRSR